MDDFPDAAARLIAVRTRIAAAARLADRDPAAVELIAVSKTFEVDAIAPFLDAGHRAFGENRVQETAAKWPALRSRYADVRLHLIGPLQSNKSADAVALFDVIHSVDRATLVTALARACTAQARAPDCYLQVNIGNEPQKAGCSIAALPDLLAAAQDAGLRVAGLMAIPPVGIEPAPFFALLGKLAARHGLSALSIGMSDDFETAVMLGATAIRVGSALFGARG